MKRLLYVKSSPRDDRSYSGRAAEAFIAAYRLAHPDDAVEELDLWKTELPRIDGQTLAAKYARMGKRDFTPEQEAAWSTVVAAIDHFRSFDKMVFSVPMWNFNVPYVLKHYIDVLVQPSVTYGVDAQGKLGGFVKDKKVICICAAGSVYDEGAPLAPGDFLRPYLKWIFKWIGIGDLQIELVAPTTKGDDAAMQALEKSISTCREMARTF